ncbi:GntR family transcriptional repressor for pyruvate dehydrogenase complex [Sphingomonas jinjuensis]|uniref:GntR family transcriptional repressor for pyruvate dehydrogenase complex n=1 Tax=Sphingomonas jinjuensis TaxID=535907 RepID=A0A840F4A3_9SPHN|nr:GntR family transcriptional repressor for pyruvate dehydrogenase complex [Sphingomonas jinjuensis]
MARKTSRRGGSSTASADGRLYQRLAKRIVDALAAGRWNVGDRLPAERELALEFGASRPAVREALIALEVRGLIDVRIGSGAYVVALSAQYEDAAFAITAFELTEARLLFEGEAAALAAINIDDDELSRLDELIAAIAAENLHLEVTENADRDFHLTIATATRNAGILRTIEDFWRLRSTSSECALLHKKARDAKVRPVVEEHAAIVEALRSRDPAAAREAMHAHLTAVMDHLLFATEELAVEEARRQVANKRRRYGSATLVQTRTDPR